jgi:hypothetical protein
VLALGAEARLGESGQGVRRAPSSAQAATSFPRACCSGVFVVPAFVVPALVFGVVSALVFGVVSALVFGVVSAFVYHRL